MTSAVAARARGAAKRVLATRGWSVVRTFPEAGHEALWTDLAGLWPDGEVVAFDVGANPSEGPAALHLAEDPVGNSLLAFAAHPADKQLAGWTTSVGDRQSASVDSTPTACRPG